MARPLMGEFALNETFNCKLSETESRMLSSLSYTMGLTKSEVVRLFIRYGYVMLSDLCFEIQKEIEKSKKSLTINEMKKKIHEKFDREYLSYFDTKNMEEGDFLMTTVGDIPVKMSKSCISSYDKKTGQAKIILKDCRVAGVFDENGNPIKKNKNKKV